MSNIWIFILAVAAWLLLPKEGSAERRRQLIPVELDDDIRREG